MRPVPDHEMRPSVHRRVRERHRIPPPLPGVLLHRIHRPLRQLPLGAQMHRHDHPPIPRRRPRHEPLHRVQIAHPRTRPRTKPQDGDRIATPRHHDGRNRVSPGDQHPGRPKRRSRPRKPRPAGVVRMIVRQIGDHHRRTVSEPPNRPRRRRRLPQHEAVQLPRRALRRRHRPVADRPLGVHENHVGPRHQATHRPHQTVRRLPVELRPPHPRRVEIRPERDVPTSTQSDRIGLCSYGSGVLRRCRRSQYGHHPKTKKQPRHGAEITCPRVGSPRSTRLPFAV